MTFAALKTQIFFFTLSWTHMNTHTAQKKNQKQLLFRKASDTIVRGKNPQFSAHNQIAESTLAGLAGRAVSNDACDTSGAEFKPHISEIAFPQPKALQEESCCSDNRMSKLDRNHHPNSDKLWA